MYGPKSQKFAVIFVTTFPPCMPRFLICNIYNGKLFILMISFFTKLRWNNVHHICKIVILSIKFLSQTNRVKL